MIFENPKKGDAVAVFSSGGVLSRSAIERVTKTTIVTDHGTVYMRNTGNQRGQTGWRVPYAECWTDDHDDLLKEQNAANRRRNRIKFLGDFIWKNLTDEQLDKITVLAKSFNTEPQLAEQNTEN